MAAITAGVVTAGAGLYSARQDRKSAQRNVESMERQKQESQDYIERATKQARGDIFKLFPAAQKSRQKGIESGIGMFNKSMPFQMEAFQQGNVGAQQALAQGLPQIQNAILGNPVDMSQIQPQRLNPGMEGLMAGPAPQSQGIESLFAQNQQPQNTQFNQNWMSGNKPLYGIEGYR